VAARNLERVLVIHTAFLGDIVLATPFLAGLRAELPEAEIHFLTTGGGVAILENNPWGVRAIPFHKRGADAGFSGLWRKGRELKALRPDLVFCLHRSLRSTILTKLVGGESWGFREGAASFLFRHRVSRDGIAYEAEKNLALLKGWAGRNDFSPYPKLGASAADEERASELLRDAGRFVVLAPSSVWATKRWPGEKFGELALRIQKELGLATVIVGSEEDKAATQAVLEKAPASLDFTGKTSLGALKSVLSKADLVVSNDSSPLHIAIAMGTKVVGVFGPTTKELGFFPLAPAGRAAVAEVKELECRPCGLHGHDRCPLGHFRCMLDLEVNQVFGEVSQLLCPP
jgi:heptosyltransferase-2